MKNQKGFSLIELLIVVVIIGIIAAIAIPNLLAARRSANEGSAASSLRTIHGASATYQATNGVGNFPGVAGNTGQTAVTQAGAGIPAGLAQLGGLNLIDQVLAAGSKSGYSFGYGSINLNSTGTPPTPATFAAEAEPQVSSGLTMTGTRGFAISTDGVMATVPTNGAANTFALDVSNAVTGATFGNPAGTTVMGNQ